MKKIFGNKWVKFGVVSLIYVLWFVLWRETWWTLLGLVVIYDIYISKWYLKAFWNKHLRIKDKNKSYNFVAGWVEAIVFAVVVASLFRIYFVEMYVIPTSSMERTLLVGDYLGVSKVSYGPKLPNTPLSIPFVHNVNPLNPKNRSYVDWIQNPYRRLAGFQEIKRGDVVVFNYPQGDTVAVEYPQINYYQLVRNYGRDVVLKQSELMYHPVDKRDNYIKRCVAISGDTLQVIEGLLFVNGVAEGDIKNRQHLYTILTDNVQIPRKVFEDFEIVNEDIFYNNQNNQYQTFLTVDMADKFSKIKGVKSVDRVINRGVDIDVFPYDTTNYKWTVDNFGPLVVPYKGERVQLTLLNLPLYERIIKNYENNTLEVKDGVIYINSEKADSYTFKMNYFFMMGDNRHNSVDSRMWGFVPEDHVVGKASFVWLSIDKNKKFPNNIRFKRMFKSINNEI